MGILFISDLHLSENEIAIANRFILFLRNIASKHQAIYILGDFFNFWIGDDLITPFTVMIYNELKLLTEQNIPVYLMYGNRDFFYGKQFENQTGCKLIKDPHVITINQNRILLTHGDSLCTLDKKHQIFRKTTNNSFLKKLFLMQPLSKRLAIADKIRSKSNIRAQERKQNPALHDIVQIDAEKILESNKANMLIHGHTHKPGIHKFEKNGIQHTRIVLGAWNLTSGNYIEIEQNGDFSLHYFY